MFPISNKRKYKALVNVKIYTKTGNSINIKKGELISAIPSFLKGSLERNYLFKDEKKFELEESMHFFITDNPEVFSWVK